MSLRRNFLNPTVYREPQPTDQPKPEPNKRQKKIKEKAQGEISPITSDEEQEDKTFVKQMPIPEESLKPLQPSLVGLMP
jgi:hypothetical protein